MENKVEKNIRESVGSDSEIIRVTMDDVQVGEGLVILNVDPDDESLAQLA